ncbi:MAG: hypothetical protein DMD81_27100 [Candidatus Rokuibacteriota bacterium]|nr:MAG: hypothetical protein DMD81_27100 [Candidatus Rokubacteria bacterium]
MVSTELRFFSGSSTWRASSPAQASRAVIVCDLDTLSIDARWLSGPCLGNSPVTTLSTSTLATHEKDEAALRERKDRVAGPFGAATRLGVPASTLESKIKALQIDKRRFKSG